jgi:hypothetical protein
VVPGFLGKAVSSVHDNLKYWEDTFEVDPYVRTILKEGYRIPVKMTAAQSILCTGSAITRALETKCNSSAPRLLDCWRTGRSWNANHLRYA